jgi:hypothetical protein
MSLKSDLATGFIARRRLRILKTLLGEEGTYFLNEVELQERLQSTYRVSTEELRDDLRHLRENDCVRIEIDEGLWGVTLTRTGGQAADGRVEVSGVARPAPGI